MSKKGRSTYTSNDQRAIVKNPTSHEYRVDQAHRAAQAAAQPAPATSEPSKR